eukprot:2923854-Pyramimonas_sp.AAC.1
MVPARNTHPQVHAHSRQDCVDVTGINASVTGVCVDVTDSNVDVTGICVDVTDECVRFSFPLCVHSRVLSHRLAAAKPLSLKNGAPHFNPPDAVVGCARF